jgi:hypothetical protein
MIGDQLSKDERRELLHGEYVGPSHNQEEVRFTGIGQIVKAQIVSESLRPGATVNEVPV